jgi:hypothetical protein
MSYSTIAKCTQDQAFLDRLSACIADEEVAHGDAASPSLHLDAFRWAVASANDIEAAYASALAGDNPDPGGDDAVITDQMILSSVQANWSTVFPEGAGVT